MKRIQLFEFEDFAFFPNWIRTCMTNLIVVFSKMMGIPKSLSPFISNILKENDLSSIVDLGSGSGGVMPDVIKYIHREAGMSKVDLIMTDLYPNKEAVKRFNNDGNDKIKYNANSVNATNFTTAPEGLKTMLNCFHHMRPEDAKKILTTAEENKQPLLIYEMSENKMPLLLWWIFLPISLIILVVMALFLTPFVRPMTWKQLVFTYLIPIIPVFYAWDGQASMPRMYSMKDIDQLLVGLNSPGYSWEKGYVKTDRNKTVGTYLLGLPKK